MTSDESIPPERATRIAGKYAKALENYDDLGTFQRALSNSMTGRSYEWDIDEFETVLSAMAELGVSTGVPRNEDPDRWDEITENG